MGHTTLDVLDCHFDPSSPIGIDYELTLIVHQSDTHHQGWVSEPRLDTVLQQRVAVSAIDGSRTAAFLWVLCSSLTLPGHNAQRCRLEGDSWAWVLMTCARLVTRSRHPRH